VVGTALPNGFFSIGTVYAAHQITSTTQDVNGDGAINVVDIQAQAASICIVANSSVEAFFIREIGKYVH
jgi:hypothetical protein